MKLEQMKIKIKDMLKNHFYRDSNLITYMEAKEMMKEDSRIILLDVRSIQEYNEYHLNGAICIPSYELQNKISNIVEDKNQTIIVYCQSGTRSKKAGNILKRMGYTSIYEIDGGIDNI